MLSFDDVLRVWCYIRLILFNAIHFMTIFFFLVNILLAKIGILKREMYY